MRILLCCICVVCCISCTGQHCFELGGVWKDVEGNFKYCYDKKESEEVTRPILVPDGEGEKIIGLFESDIDAILESQSNEKIELRLVKKLIIKEKLLRLLKNGNKKD